MMFCQKKKLITCYATTKVHVITLSEGSCLERLVFASVGVVRALMT